LEHVQGWIYLKNSGGKLNLSIYAIAHIHYTVTLQMFVIGNGGRLDSDQSLFFENPIWLDDIIIFVKALLKFQKMSFWKL